MKITSVCNNLASFLSWPLCLPLFCHHKRQNSPCFDFSNPFLHFVIGAEALKNDITSDMCAVDSVMWLHCGDVDCGTVRFS